LYDFFAKNENKCSQNFRENTKTKIFVSTLTAPMAVDNIINVFRALFKDVGLVF
jgi:hypothetical protein